MWLLKSLNFVIWFLVTDRRDTMKVTKYVGIQNLNDIEALLHNISFCKVVK